MPPESSLTNLHPTIIDLQILSNTFRDDVLSGLALAHKAVPAKHLYDTRGSEIFDDICDVPEYYPTRTERGILSANADSIARVIGPNATLIEPGSGSGDKAMSLLETLDSARAFVPIEISRSALESSARTIAQRFPDLEVHPVCADFTRDLDATVPTSNRVVFFPGSTIGNLLLHERKELLRSFATMAGDAGMVLIGHDLVKDRQVLFDAYNDSTGVTAAFNLNLLTRINAELDANFNPGVFKHDAPWNEPQHRIEMHLVSQADQQVTVTDRTFIFSKNERIHTENSHKFTPETIDAEAGLAGLSLIERWTDSNNWFSVSLFRTSP